ncbi:hypothetical protein [Lysobacter gummosus]
MHRAAGLRRHRFRRTNSASSDRSPHWLRSRSSTPRLDHPACMRSR